MKKEIDKWEIEYEKDTDTLFVSRKVIPKDARLIMINNGYSVYVNKKKEIVGIIIEYFTTEAKEMLKNLKTK